MLDKVSVVMGVSENTLIKFKSLGHSFQNSKETKIKSENFSDRIG